MKKIVIPIQNISDVVTNSSSEIFICKTFDAENTVETLKEVLTSVYENYKKANDHAGRNTYAYYGENLDSILEIYIANSDSTDTFYNYSIEKGDVIIESTGENSIPPIIMDFIFEFFDYKSVERIHLG